MFDLKNVSLKFLDNLARQPIVVKIPNGMTVDAVTQKTVQNFQEIQMLAFVRQLSINTTAHSNNFLTQNARQVLFKADNISLTQDSLIVIDGIEYKVKQIVIRNGYYMVTVDEK